MNWIKKGKIFDPSEYNLPNNCREFAQSPQTLLFDDFVRIYFSTREKDYSGKYLSHIAFVDMTKDFSSVINISTKPVIELGKLGCFDEHGIFPINIFRDNDKVLAYTCGWYRKVSVSVETSVGLAYSDDQGETFQKYGDGPILTSSLHEPCLVGDAFVQKYNGQYHMWYIFGTKWMQHPDDNQPARVYKIAHAVSGDGVVWEKEGRQIIKDVIGVDECQALPTVAYYKGRYHMFFCFRYATGFREIKSRGYRIGYAWSTDLVNWQRDDELGGIMLSADGDWDSDMQCYPHVFVMDGDMYLLYNGNKFGKEGFGLAKLASL